MAKLLYVSGPMTGYPNHHFEAFNRASAVLRAVGFDVENPASKGVIDGWTWADYLKYDLERLVHCDGVATLPGWQESKGAVLEVHVAQQLDISVRPVEVWLENFVDPLAFWNSGTVL